MSSVRLEFTVEPFNEGGPGPHVLAAISAVTEAGFTPDEGPFGTAVEGDASAIIVLMSRVSQAAIAAGATGLRISLQEVVEAAAVAPDLLLAVRPIIDALGGTFVSVERMRPGDVPLDWHGQRVGGVRPPLPPDADLGNALEAAVAEVESMLGGRLNQLSRTEKQHAARLLNERGVFQLRNAVDEVADAMSVSRATIYNYLSAARRDR